MSFMSKSVRIAILTGSILAVAETSSQAVILYQQNFDTDPVNYTASPFINQGTGLDATSKYWDLKNNIPATILNPNLVGNTTNYITGQNMDASLPFATGTPAFVDFTANIGTSVVLTLALDLAGLPTAEVENYVRAFTDNDGNGTYDTQIFNFVGSNNSPYIDAGTGQQLSGTFQTFSNFTLPIPTAADKLVRVRIEVFNDTDSQNEAQGLDNIRIDGLSPGRNIIYNRSHTVGGAPNGVLGTTGNYFLQGATPTAFGPADIVNFSQDGSATIDVPANVSTGGVVVSNATGTYTIGGLGRMTGPLTKSNAGTVVFTSANSFSGATISGGTVETQAGALGTGSVIISGGALWKVTTAAQNQNGSIGAETGGGTLQADFDLSAAGLDGTGTLTKTGTGILTLRGGGSGTGILNVTSGKLSLGGAVGGATQTINLNGNPLDFTNTAEITFSDVANPRILNLGPGANTINVVAAGGGVIIGGPDGLVSGGTITKVGPGALRMAGTQAALTSNWIVNEGTLEARAGNPLGSGTVTVNPTSRFASQNTTVTNNVILAGGELATRSGDLADFSGTVNVTAPSTAYLRSYTTVANAQDIRISGVLSGTGELTVLGNTGSTKSLILANAANTYAGSIRVTESQTLQLDGGLTSTASQVSVAGTISGRGTTAGKVTVDALGTMAPGPGAAVLSIGSDVLMSPGSNLSLELEHGVEATPVAGTDYDQVKIGTGTGATSTGTVSLDGTNLILTLGFAILPNDLFFVVVNDGTDAITGRFANQPEGSVINSGGLPLRITYAANSTTNQFTGGNDVALMAIPEPGSAGLMLAGSALLLRRRRKVS